MSIKLTFEVETPEDAVDFLERFNGVTPKDFGVTPKDFPVSTLEAIPTADADKPATIGKAVIPDRPQPSAAVVAFAEEHDIELDGVVGTGKDGRITKKDVQAVVDAKEPEPEADDPFAGGQPEAPEPDPFADEDDPFADDEADAPEEPVTKETVRAALVEYQAQLKAKYIKKGQDQAKASKAAQERARAILNKYAPTLGGLDENQYAKVQADAKKALTAL